MKRLCLALLAVATAACATTVKVEPVTVEPIHVKVDVTVKDEETCWQFRPRQPWTAGGYRLVVDTSLEDLAGNNLARPFEVDVFHPIQRKLQTKTTEVPFQVAGGK